MMENARNARVVGIVFDAIDGALHALDIRRDDLFEDRAAWQNLRREMGDLLLRAYRRNHDGEP
jgi:hypothetical protein